MLLRAFWSASWPSWWVWWLVVLVVVIVVYMVRCVGFWRFGDLRWHSELLGLEQCP